MRILGGRVLAGLFAQLFELFAFDHTQLPVLQCDPGRASCQVRVEIAGKSNNALSQRGSQRHRSVDRSGHRCHGFFPMARVQQCFTDAHEQRGMRARVRNFFGQSEPVCNRLFPVPLLKIVFDHRNHRSDRARRLAELSRNVPERQRHVAVLGRAAIFFAQQLKGVIEFPRIFGEHRALEQAIVDQFHRFVVFVE